MEGTENEQMKENFDEDIEEEFEVSYQEMEKSQATKILK